MTDYDDNRPDPDLLLSAVKDSEVDPNKGQLKIFLGAAPGVGKTYAMLEAAHKAQADGINVMVGVIETHGREETEKLIAGLNLSPLKKIRYNKKVFYELDTDRIVHDNPQLVLVDELPHTNTPGSTHKKRYQDILDILDAGIDVYTTVNVQHMESLHDEIKQITGIEVRATVPDSIFERAEETVVIDLTPSELIERLNEGKVYVPTQVRRATNNFFTQNNLAALRALALQVAAKSITRRVITYRQVHGIDDPWSVSGRVMVCITDSGATPRLVRSAKRLASEKDADLKGLYIDPPLSNHSREKKTRILKYKRYTEHLGAEVETLTAVDVAKCIIQCVRGNNITDIVLSKSVSSRFVDFILGSVVNDVIRNSGKINIHILSERPQQDRVSVVKRLVGKYSIRRQKEVTRWAYLYSLISILMTALISFPLSKLGIIDNNAVPMLFLLGVIYTAYKWNFKVSILSAFLSSAFICFFFEKPYYAFGLGKASVIVTLLIFMTLSYIINRVNIIMGEQARKATEREKLTNILHHFSSSLADATDLHSLLDLITGTIHRTLNMQAILILPKIGDESRLVLKSSTPRIDKLTNKAWATANWAWKHKKTSGRGTNTLSSSNWFFMPIDVGEEWVAVVGVKIRNVEDFFDSQLHSFFQSLVDQAAIAIGRTRLAEAPKVQYKKLLHAPRKKIKTNINSSYKAK